MSDEGENPGGTLSDEAIDWLVRLSSGHATSSDRFAFKRWRERSAMHEAAAAEAEALLRDVAATRQASGLRSRAEMQSIASLPHRVGRRTVFAGITAAAASVAVVAVGPNLQDHLSGLYADYATAIGERKRIALDDGSTVTLNTATALSVDYSGHERRIALYGGEASFEVAKDPNRPFIVTAGNAQARAVGTAFVLQRNAMCERVVVTEGTVEVTVGKAAAVRLEVGQALALGEVEGQKVLSVDVDVVTAWQRGKLIFNRRSLQSVVAELERYRRGRIVIANEDLKALQVTGVFDLDDPDRLLRTLAETSKARVTYLPLLTIIR
ncbi:FecR family protein [Reyranella sp.]|uniref:FecR family protein n=1 Tax=Reyranella sp. TaxID=1929291 RepID=UPI003BAA3A0D